MLKCPDCGKLMPKDELILVEKNYDHDGYYKNDMCRCGGYYEEAVQCENCGEWFLKKDLYGGLCEDCIDENINIETISEYVEKYDLKGEIYEYLQDFISHNKEHFGEFIKNRG